MGESRRERNLVSTSLEEHGCITFGDAGRLELAHTPRTGRGGQAHGIREFCNLKTVWVGGDEPTVTDADLALALNLLGRPAGHRLEQEGVKFSDYFDAPELGLGRTIVLVGRDGIVRARRYQHQSEVGQDISSSPLFTHIKSSDVGSYEVVSPIDGQSKLASFRAVRGSSLVVVVSELKETALAGVHARAKANRAAALFFIWEIWSESFWGMLKMCEYWERAWMMAWRIHQTA